MRGLVKNRMGRGHLSGTVGHLNDTMDTFPAPKDTFFTLWNTIPAPRGTLPASWDTFLALHLNIDNPGYFQLILGLFWAVLDYL